MISNVCKEEARRGSAAPGLFLTHITLYDILSRGWAVIYYKQEVL
jgi:hypothetical protein